MGFLLNGQPLSVGRPFTDADGTQYPANWLRLASEEEKEAIGITWEDDPAPVNGDFYFAAGQARPLEDQPVVDDEGEPVLDENGQQRIDEGLKTRFVAEQKQTAGVLLAQSDWYVTRKAETDAAIPADVLAYRESVRTISGTRESEINACTTVAELEALMTNPAKVYDEATDSMVANTEPFITPWPEAL